MGDGVMTVGNGDVSISGSLFFDNAGYGLYLVDHRSLFLSQNSWVRNYGEGDPEHSMVGTHSETGAQSPAGDGDDEALNRQVEATPRFIDAEGAEDPASPL